MMISFIFYALLLILAFSVPITLMDYSDQKLAASLYKTVENSNTITIIDNLTYKNDEDDEDVVS